MPATTNNQRAEAMADLTVLLDTLTARGVYLDTNSWDVPDDLKMTLSAAQSLDMRLQDHPDYRK